MSLKYGDYCSEYVKLILTLGLIFLQSDVSSFMRTEILEKDIDN